VQAQEEAELAQLQKAKRKALEQRDAQMRQLDDLKARILAERCPSILFSQHVAACHHSARSVDVLQTHKHKTNWSEGVSYLVCD
jgi:uncharacterized protein (UPF0276 family)